ncbi:potassium channel protein [Aureibaculum sp. 2210JD6-5]|uniref:potassium channel family protein n=1 Tax=Aureibaculum sp. 2210JD6-5 TaxID=3103957 RepID=UPI002AAEE244|nr:potassium channel protein [Aureibaculum sp. 2210JD6-5]MDY7395506.1 potassium channel protein [Aureibaculum sp. 2210JD6-5]
MFKSKLYTALLLFIGVICVGVFGYMYFSDDTFINALYMTVITITTVGFGEVHPLSQSERVFTIFLILMSVLSLGYAASVITQYIASGEFLKNLKTKKVQKTIEKLNGHTVVCGYGRNGKQATVKLGKFKKPFVIIENDEERITEIEDENLLYVKGDATVDDVLEKAAIDKASSLITTLPSDADNLYVVLPARQLNKDLTIVSRASNDSSDAKLRIAGANNVIMPDKLGGEHMASLLVTPDIVEFVDKLAANSENATHLEEIIVDKLPKEFLLKSIRDLDLRKKTGCSIIGFKTPENEYMINPDAETKLISNSKLIVLGSSKQIQNLNKLF